MRPGPGQPWMPLEAQEHYCVDRPAPARLVRHGGQLIMRLAPGPWLLPEILAAIRALPAPG